MARKILVVDDEKLIVKGIRFGLEQDGMEVDAAYDGEEALEYVRANSYDMILIDKIMGLEYGADDYMTKPFNILEVKARIKAILRRNEKSKVVKEASGKSVYGDLSIDFEGRRVYIKDNEINLTAKEFDLLELLVKDENKVYSREKLLDIIWGSDYPGDVRTVDVHIRRLREKIEETPGEPRYIHTKWGVGYYFKN